MLIETNGRGAVPHQSGSPLAVSVRFLIVNVAEEGLSVHVRLVQRSKGGLRFESREAALHVSGGATHIDLVTASHAVKHHLRLLFIFGVVIGIRLGTPKGFESIWVYRESTKFLSFSREHATLFVAMSIRRSVLIVDLSYRHCPTAISLLCSMHPHATDAAPPSFFPHHKQADVRGISRNKRYIYSP